MSLLGRLDIYQLRNIQEGRHLNFSKVNIFTGANGAGKTSVLEAIYLLGTGRSFRGNRTANLIARSAESFTIYGELNDLSRPDTQGIGLTKAKSGDPKIYLNRRPISTLAELASALPVQIINADAFLLIDGGSKSRRHYIDWGVFHVKNDFIDAWRRTQRCLKQRNFALKQYHRHVNDRMECSTWNKELSNAAKIVDARRSKYVDEITPMFNDMLQRLSADAPKTKVLYKRGWREDIDLIDALAECEERDFKYATSTVGPHRANLEISVDGAPAVEALSRGQKKLVVTALKLAQGQYFMEHAGRECIYLIDDLSAELDRGHRNAFCALLDEMGCQAFITSVDADFLDYQWKKPDDVSWFHVKHGHVSSYFSKTDFSKKAKL